MSLFMDVNETLGILYLIFLIQGWRLFSNILLHFTHPSLCVCSASLTKRMKKKKSHLSIISTPIHLIDYVLSAIRVGEGKWSDGAGEGKEQHHKSENIPLLFGIRRGLICTQWYIWPTRFHWHIDYFPLEKQSGAGIICSAAVPQESLMGPLETPYYLSLVGQSHNSPFSETFRWYSLLSPAHMKIFIHNC